MPRNFSNPEYEKELASWLQKLREEKGISQEALGIQIGKGQSDIAKIESGKKRINVMDVLLWMKALDIGYERLESILSRIYNSLDGNKSLWDRK